MTNEQLKQAIAEYKQIYFEEYGKELSDFEATEQANALLTLFDTLSRKEQN